MITETLFCRSVSRHSTKNDTREMLSFKGSKDQDKLSNGPKSIKFNVILFGSANQCNVIQEYLNDTPDAEKHPRLLRVSGEFQVSNYRTNSLQTAENGRVLMSKLRYLKDNGTHDVSNSTGKEDYENGLFVGYRNSIVCNASDVIESNLQLIGYGKSEKKVTSESPVIDCDEDDAF